MSKDKNNRILLKSFLATIVAGLLALAALAFGYSMCSWGGCSSGGKAASIALLIVSAISAAVSAVYFFGWFVNAFKYLVSRT